MSNYNNRMIKLIIFDAYGTLIDTKDGSIKAAKAILTKNNSSIDEREFYSKWKLYHRKHIDSLTEFVCEQDIFLMDLRSLYKEYGISGDAEEDVKIMLSTLGVREVYSDTNYVISELRKKYKVYIGSTSDETPLISDMNRNGLKVDTYFTSEKLKFYKPRKEFFITMLDQIGSLPGEVIYIGDSQVDDLLGPKSAGIKTIWVNRKQDVLKDGIPKPDYEVKSLTDLLEIL